MPTDLANILKSQSRILRFESCEIWFNGQDVIVDSRLPLTDLKLCEFSRPRIVFQQRSYYVCDVSRSSKAPKLYRYILAPWPTNDELRTNEVHLNEQYFVDRNLERRNVRAERFVFRALVVFYPFLGLLWSPQKRWLNKIGFEAHAISSISVFTTFMAGFMCGTFLLIFEFGAKQMSLPLLAGLVLFIVDAVARFDRLLKGHDQVPPGFYEWLFRSKTEDD